ncbi:MAG: NAD(P)H-hydrate dehydratase [Candidatus Accumulibacter sp.]|jgi:hydroxyethylthiazole kinase-like uncharacterized protein yjeF|nr:NAD(P)H-hydrate dehydratase [Accumulibacter sp.]
MTPLYRSSELRKIESLAADNPLMWRAGAAAADLSMKIASGRGAAILILAGPGNNGGDAFVTAHFLRERFFDAHVVFSASPETLSGDAANAFRHFSDSGGRCLSVIPEALRWSLIVDGLFGIGLKREISGIYASLIDRANALARRDACPLLALDCPSGLDADTGARRGAAIAATHTLTFIAYKPGLFTADGPDCCGRISLAPLGLDVEDLLPPPGHIVTLDCFSRYLTPRLRNSHKGNYGNAGLLGGSDGMIGAAWLASRAMLRLGAGRVYAALTAKNAPPVDPHQPEVMQKSPDDLLDLPLNALACGPGLGTRAGDLLSRACALDIPLTLDADALNILAEDKLLHIRVAKRASPTILTPHPAEAARLLACGTGEIQSDRISAALELANRFRAYVVLKGCGTLIAAPDGKWFVNTSGNPGLSTAGSGDVLTGLISALLAQGWPPLEALLCAAHLHGAAADRLAGETKGPVGLAAGELIDAARALFNEWVYGKFSV